MKFVRALKAPHYGQTHAEFTLLHHEENRFFARAYYGTQDAEGNFVKADGLMPLERDLTGEDFNTFVTANSVAYNSLVDGLVAALAI